MSSLLDDELHKHMYLFYLINIKSLILVHFTLRMISHSGNSQIKFNTHIDKTNSSFSSLIKTD